MFKEMVAETEASLVGSVERNDRSCAKVKASVRAMIDSAYAAYRDRSRAFDKTELGPGGPLAAAINKLIADR